MDPAIPSLQLWQTHRFVDQIRGICQNHVDRTLDPIQNVAMRDLHVGNVVDSGIGRGIAQSLAVDIGEGKLASRPKKLGGA